MTPTLSRLFAYFLASSDLAASVRNAGTCVALTPQNLSAEVTKESQTKLEEKKGRACCVLHCPKVQTSKLLQPTSP
ncbi:hypothetical protein VTN96DRAFT_1893 [Rasamsonia emersonii]